MSDTDHVLGLLDDLMRLAESSPAVTIEVEADAFSVSVTRRGASRPAEASLATTERPALVTSDAEPTRPPTQRVHATTVGIFNPKKEWRSGDAVKRGDELGGIQSLGHVAKVVAPADGEIKEVLVGGGAPVEYGQPLLVINLG
ncbi:MAG TPA: biotin/lipoyl-containing protein [Candidatus Limnocylindria bacterium]|jgi:biotin carboxyl carrier protein|nr:biotin/lipoyl-containing protein [Candidatus Limnocylindria bacterium]